MIKNTKNKLFFFTELFGLFFVASFANAQYGYHLLASIPTIKEGEGVTLSVYMQAIYQLIIGLGIIFAVVMIAVGGVQYVMAIIPSAKQEGKSRIVGAIFGLILLLSSWVILNTLNPQLLKAGLNLPGITIISPPVTGGGGGNDLTKNKVCSISTGSCVVTGADCKTFEGETAEADCSAEEKSKENTQADCSASVPKTNMCIAKRCNSTAYTYPNKCKTENGKLSQDQAEDILKDGGVEVKVGVKLEGVRTKTLNEVVNTKQACGCEVVVTSATGGSHASGEYSHANGYKIDLRLGSAVSGYIKNNYTYIGTRGDGARQYQAPSGAVYAEEASAEGGPHWDIVVR